MSDSTSKIKEFLETETQQKIGDKERNLIEQGVLDSFTMIRLISFIEEKLGVPIDMEKLTPENFNSLATIVRTIEPWR